MNSKLFKFYNWIKSKRIEQIEIEKPKANTVQQDVRIQTIIKRVNAEYDKQEPEILARSIKAHASDCNNEWNCEKDPCFIYEPDKIVGEPYKVELTEKIKTRRFNKDFSV